MVVSNQTLLDEYFQPANMRVDLMSSTFGRAADYETSENDEVVLDGAASEVCGEDEEEFDPSNAGTPSLEPMFGARYWCRGISESLMKEWAEACQPESKPSGLSLPPRNPFVPENLALKPLPLDDSHHPLVHCSLKICITVGKKKVSVCPTCPCNL